MKREEILKKAQHLVCGAREQEYAPPKQNFTRIAKLWSVVLGIEVTAPQVALCMNQVKVTRLIESPIHQDSWVDLAGYAACGGEVAELITPVKHYSSIEDPNEQQNANFWGVPYKWAKSKQGE